MSTFAFFGNTAQSESVTPVCKVAVYQGVKERVVGHLHFDVVRDVDIGKKLVVKKKWKRKR